MKKSILFLIAIFFAVGAFTQVQVYDINEDFESAEAPWGISGQFEANTTIIDGTEGHGKVLQTFATGSGSRTGTKSLGTLTLSDNGTLCLDFDLYLGVTASASAGSGGIFNFVDASGKPIIAFAYDSRVGAASPYGFHFINLTPPATLDNGYSTNVATTLIPDIADNTWTSIHAVLNFDTHKIDTIKIGSSYEEYGVAFLDATAELVTDLNILYHRAGADANVWKPQIDNFQIYHYKYEPITYDINEDFESAEAPWGISGQFEANTTIIDGPEGHGKVLQTFATGSGSRTGTKSLGTLTLSDNGTLCLDFDLYLGVTASASAGSGGIFNFIDASGKPIIAFAYDSRVGAASPYGFHFINLTPPATLDNGYSTNVATTLIPDIADNTWTSIHAVLNFETNKIDTIKIGSSYEEYGVAFLDATAGLLTDLNILYHRAGADANVWKPQIDNFQIYHYNAGVDPYEAFTAYVASVQASHDAENRTGAFITATKATLQNAINTAAAITELSTAEEIAAAKAELQAALAQFNEDLLVYASLQTAVTTITNRVTEVTPRIGAQFLNYLQDKVDVLATAQTTAETALSTAATVAELNDAVAAVNTALSTFDAEGRVAPSTNAYKIYTYGVDEGNFGSEDGGNLYVKKIIYGDGTAVKYSEDIANVTNTEWIIVQTANVYTITNKALGTYLVGATLAEDVANMTFKDVKGQTGETSKDEGYFFYGILNEGGSRALEVDPDGTLRFATGIADRGRFCFQFEEVSIPVTGVILNRTNTETNPATLAVGASQNVIATITPTDADNAALVWTSSDEAVATVSGGELATVGAQGLRATATVTGVAPGTATITVTTVDGGLTASYVVNVPVPVVAVTGVSLDKTAETIEIDDNLQLTATVAPANATNPAISWSSSDETVATVTEGLVTGVSAGKAIITVTTTDGNFTATCEVTVTPTVGITNIDKPVQSIRYYNLNGIQVTENTTGFQIRKITYADGSVEVVKTFVKEK